MLYGIFMTKRLIKPILCISFLAFSKFAFADYAIQGIKVNCEEENATIESFLLINEHASNDAVVLDDGSSVYFGVDQTFSCKLAKHEIHGTIRNTAGTDPGTCHAVPFSTVTVMADDKVIFKDQAFKNPDFTNKCYESISSVSFYEDDDDFRFKYCGDTGLESTPHVTACVNFPKEQYEKLKFPLTKTPVSAIVNIKGLLKK